MSDWTPKEKGGMRGVGGMGAPELMLMWGLLGWWWLVGLVYV